MAKVYEYFERKLSWHYLTAPGASFFGVLADALDATLASAKDAVRQRILSKCVDEALPYIAQNFNLDYPKRFTVAQARAYLADPWTHWEDAGT